MAKSYGKKSRGGGKSMKKRVNKKRKTVSGAGRSPGGKFQGGGRF